MKRLTAESRAELEGRRERLQLELRFVEAELRSVRRCGYRIGSLQRTKELFFIFFFIFFIFLNKQFEGCNEMAYFDEYRR
jgi:hypothetical protein